MKEVIDITLSAIHDRLLKSKKMHSEPIPVTTPEDSDQERLRDFRARFGDRRMARSDELVTEDDIRVLNDKVDKIREVLLHTGKPVIEHPSYAEEIKLGKLDPEDYKDTVFVEDEGIFIRTDLAMPEDSFGERLAIDVPDKKMSLAVDFQEGYSIHIAFGDDPNSEEYAEYYQYDYLSAMTIEEYSIMGHFIEQAERILNERA